MMFSPTVARIIAFAVAAWVFIGLMLLVAYFVAAPFSNWVGEQTRGWPAWATIGSVVVFIVLGQWGARALNRRDQRRNDRAAL